jgi:hypothetical protein
VVAHVQFGLELVDDIVVNPFLPLLVKDQLLKHLFVVRLVSYGLVDLLLHQLEPTLLLSHYPKLWGDCLDLMLQMLDFFSLIKEALALDSGLILEHCSQSFVLFLKFLNLALRFA